MAYGKALGNGFAVSALAGRREIMELGGLRHNRPRVFLLSTTHGAETPGSGRGMRRDSNLPEQPVVDDAVAAGTATGRPACGRSFPTPGLDGYFDVIGRPCNLVYVARDAERRPSQAFRTLFLRETLRRGLLMPSMVVSYAHDDATIEATIERVGEALTVYKRALEDGVERFLPGRPVQPVMRRFN